MPYRAEFAACHFAGGSSTQKRPAYQMADSTPKRSGVPMLVGSEASASMLLHELELRTLSLPGERVLIGDILRGQGTRFYGLALLLFALPEALPIPAMGLTGLVAIPIFLVALSMAIWGARGELPGWVLRRRVKRSWVLWIIRRGRPLIVKIERVSHPRYVILTELARPIGVFCVVLTLIMAIPFPFSNAPPGVVIAIIGLGIFQRDGALVAVGVGLGAIVLTVVGVLLFLGGRTLL